jgi:enoyl-CoA hydratase
MCETVLRALSDWEDDPDIAAILIDAVPGRAFCAGGDIRAVYDLGRAGDPRVLDFFTTEYRMNAAIAGCAKPYISILNGAVMGGGAGISVHGRFRVATENTVFAMPETAIGFFPDVGGSFFLSRCPGAIGMYLGLTGLRIDGADMRYAGLATHYLPAARNAELVSRLIGGEEPDHALAALSVDGAGSRLRENRAAIDRVFGAASVEKILIGLTAEKDWGTEITQLLRTRSPTSLSLVHRQLREGATRDLAGCLEMELGIAAKVLKGHDFYEGVRAALVDKDQTPHWCPATIEDVDAEEINRFFQSPMCSPADQIGTVQLRSR